MTDGTRVLGCLDAFPGNPSLSYCNLSRFRLRGMRNGNWRHLGRIDKGLYNCALLLARSRGRIVNRRLLVLVKSIIRRLLATVKMRILQVGEAKAEDLLESYARNAVFEWAPEVRSWLGRRTTVFYLGAMELFGR